MLKAASKWIQKKPTPQPHLTPPDTFHSPKIEMYDLSNIHLLDWPKSEDGIYAKNLLSPFLKMGVNHFIDNIETELKILKIDDVVIPITINDAEYSNSFVCSPHSYYITYSMQSMHIIKSPVLRSLFKGFFVTLSTCYRFFDINKVVIVNNWLSSVSIYPKITAVQVSALKEFLEIEFPAHAIVFRSIDETTTPIQYQSLKDNRFTLIAARPIFFTDTNNEKIFESRLYKSDLRHLKSSGYEIVDSNQLNEGEISRLIHLYRSVYISKYSSLNPQLNQEYLKLALKQQTLHLRAIRKDGEIDGVVGYFIRNGIMHCPFFGYDKTKPQEIGLYRLLSTILMEEARKNNLLFHQSSGATMYKKIRKAQEDIGFDAVYYRHLKHHRKIPWLMIKSIFNTIGLRYMKKY